MAFPFRDNRGRIASADATRRSVALATIFRQVAQQRGHGVVFGHIAQGAPVAPGGNEAGVLKVAQMEGERGGGQIQPFGDKARGQPIAAGLHKQPEDVEARFVRERRKGGYGNRLFHISNIVELF
jgi:hypothetical protein